VVVAAAFANSDLLEAGHGASGISFWNVLFFFERATGREGATGWMVPCKSKVLPNKTAKGGATKENSRLDVGIAYYNILLGGFVSCCTGLLNVHDLLLGQYLAYVFKPGGKQEHGEERDLGKIDSAKSLVVMQLRRANSSALKWRRR